MNARGRSWAILLAGGRGSRFDPDEPKQFRVVAGMPLLVWSFLNLDSAVDELSGVTVVTLEHFLETCRGLLEPLERRCDGLLFTRGGRTRQDSVALGLATVPDDVDYVLIHDAARPLLTRAIVDALFAGLSRAGAVIPGVPEPNTLKRVDEKGMVVETIDRNLVMEIQTPQLFEHALIRKAHESAGAAGFVGTDDASLVERLGEPVCVVRGDGHNLKITKKRDIILAASLLAARRVSQP